LAEGPVEKEFPKFWILRKSAHKCACIYALIRALVMVAQNLSMFPNVQLAHKYTHIYVLIYASGIQALELETK
jgi:hypothetical protein